MIDPRDKLLQLGISTTDTAFDADDATVAAAAVTDLALIDETATDPMHEEVARIAQREASIEEHLTHLRAEVIVELADEVDESEENWLDVTGKKEEDLKEESLAKFDTLEDDGTTIDTSRFKRYLKPALVALACLVIAGAAFAYFGYFQEGMTHVPDLIGLTSTQAAARLIESGLSVGEIVEEPTSSVAVGIVLNQEPKVDQLVARGTTVRIIVAGDAGVISVPKVSDLSVEQARSTLNQERLTMIEVPTFDALTMEGAIVGQLPIADTLVKAGSSVVVLVCQGPTNVPIPTPRVMGLSEVDAAAVLERSGFLGLPYHAQTTFGQTGEVVAQTPSSGSLTYPGAPVQYLISENIAGADSNVPDTVGMREENAKLILDEAGFGMITYPYVDSEVATGTVVAQMPLSQDMLIAKGSDVELLVARGDDIRQSVPNVLNMNLATARETLRELGFRPIVVPLPETVGQGNVYQQFPAQDSDYYQGLPVVIYAGQPLH
ncbi:MAG: PASTA domain-containing protein [Actinomycetia bacterium]|nr:PASTA domain-containing protein [Actinomycetes bacterium]